MSRLGSYIVLILQENYQCSGHQFVVLDTEMQGVLLPVSAGFAFPGVKEVAL